MSKKIRIVLADDHEIVRTGIKQMLESEDYIDVVGEASDGKEAIDKVVEHNPDVLIMDISMPNMTGIDATRELVKKNLSTKILILSMFDTEEYVLRSVELGAHGYLLKDTDKAKFIKAISKVVGGEKYFSSEISNIIVNQYLKGKGGESVTPAMPTEPQMDLSDFDLTKREREILSKVVQGYNNKAIAEELGISIRTIETHRLHIMKKLKVNNAADLVRVALQYQLT